MDYSIGVNYRGRKPLYKTITLMNNELQLKKEGFVGLMVAKETISRQLRKMSIPGIPIKVQEYATGNESMFVFIANGICATLHIQPFNPATKGGEA